MSLLFALLALVSLSLASVALVRSVDTGALVLGNLGLKQDATAISDQAANKAIEWLTNNATLLSQNTDLNALNGYYATSNEDLDVTGQQLPNDGSPRSLVNWDVNECAYAADIVNANCKLTPSSEIDINGSKVRYVILRMCEQVGDSAATSCATPLTSSVMPPSTRGAINVSSGRNTLGKEKVFYRIVVRVVGARKTTTFSETIVYIPPV